MNNCNDDDMPELIDDVDDDDDIPEIIEDFDDDIDDSDDDDIPEIIEDIDDDVITISGFKLKLNSRSLHR